MSQFFASDGQSIGVSASACSAGKNQAAEQAGITQHSWQFSRRFNQSILKEMSPEYSLEVWCRSWNSNTLATWCKELTHWKIPWCWERLRAGGEGNDRGWDGWMISPSQWTWVWASSGSWWWTGKPGVLWFMGSQRVGHDWATELNFRIWSKNRPGS